jgi:hypothetical protein
MATTMLRDPNFLIIGAARCANGWLRYNLGQHPEVYLPTVPLDYFAAGVPPFEGPPFGDARRRVGSSRRWYRLQLTGAEDRPLVGEASAGYLARVNRPGAVSAAIDAALPGVKLIALVRSPVERLYSAFARAVQTGHLPVGTDLVELIDGGGSAVEQLDLIGGGDYAPNLHPYLSRFGDRLLVLRVDDLRADPVATYDTALAHLGASPGFRPDGLERVRFASRVDGLVPPLDLATRRHLYRWYRRGVEDLETMLGWDLSGWDPGPDLVSPASS